MRLNLPGGKAIELVQGDLTQEQADAIVNAANGCLMPGGGVCGAIHRVGGPVIARECAAIIERRGMLATGEAVVTSAGNLPARHVIHTVGPVWRGGEQGEPKALADCYRASIRIADEMEISSIAFPSISTGIFGYPVREAAAVALRAVREGLAGTRNLFTVRFVLFDVGTLEAYRTAAAGV